MLSRNIAVMIATVLVLAGCSSSKDVQSQEPVPGPPPNAENPPSRVSDYCLSDVARVPCFRLARDPRCRKAHHPDCHRIVLMEGVRREVRDAFRQNPCDPVPPADYASCTPAGDAAEVVPMSDSGGPLPVVPNRPNKPKPEVPACGNQGGYDDYVLSCFRTVSRHCEVLRQRPCRQVAPRSTATRRVKTAFAADPCYPFLGQSTVVRCRRYYGVAEIQEVPHTVVSTPGPLQGGSDNGGPAYGTGPDCAPFPRGDGC